ADGVEVVTYGTHEHADHRIVDVERGGTGTRLVVVDGGERHRLDLPVPGMHNARNAVAAFVMGRLLGVAPDAGQRALGRFGGVARRYEFRGEIGGVTFVDDYAHLPTEVAAAIAAARDGEWSRIVC